MTEERRALVTGAAGVMGKATVKMLVEAGIEVGMMDIREEELTRLAREFGPKTYPLPVDLLSREKIVRMVDQFERQVGPVDILINNAGILSNNKTETTAAAEWKRVMEINLDSVFYLCQAVIPGMKARGWGRIINTSSLAAKSGGLTAGTAYSTSKGGLIALTFSLAAELAGFGITVNGIAPAYVNTPMVSEQLTEDQRKQLLEKIPVHRFCEPEEFAHVVKFLIDPLAGFITGEIIDQNGGLHFD